MFLVATRFLIFGKVLRVAMMLLVLLIIGRYISFGGIVLIFSI